MVDDKNGLIVHADVVPDANDAQQFADQVNEANNNIGGTCRTACADAGYANTRLQKKIDEQNILVVVPSQKQAMDGPSGPFSKDKFVYDSVTDSYLCPMGQKLLPAGNDGYVQQYRMESKTVCLSCVHFGVCTSNKVRGRIVGRLVQQDDKDRFENQYRENKHIFQRRKEKAEHPFGHIKRNLGARSFLLRGLLGVRAEASLLATCFNMVRMINILGVAGLRQQLSTA